MQMWGIHNDTLTNELVDESFVSIGWDDVADLRTIPDGREGIKRALLATNPDAKPQSIAGQAGVLYRFSTDIAVGDVVVAPYKPDSTVNIGTVTGNYYHDQNARTHQHRLPVEWKRVGLSRTVFTQAALYEIGSFISVFQIRKHSEEFIAALNSADGSIDVVADSIDEVLESTDVSAASDEPRASRIERHTRDFILECIHRRISHNEFEHFTAALLRALGYEARVTQYAQDGGVDVIAHRDPLGVEPPQIKVQCKHRVSTIGAPEVQQLVGTQGPGELSLFVTLGNYSRDALNIERQRPGLRLLTGEDIVSLVVENYSNLPEKWRSQIPLTSLLVVADHAEL